MRLTAQASPTTDRNLSQNNHLYALGIWCLRLEIIVYSLVKVDRLGNCTTSYALKPEKAARLFVRGTIKDAFLAGAVLK